MKTIRLLYPDYLGGGLDTYYFGADLLAQILPKNEDQLLLNVNIAPPDGQKRSVTDGIYAKDEVLAGIRDAMEVIADAQPDRIITIGGDCLVSLAPFDYLHGLYKNLGIIWIDAHPDVSTEKDGYPNAHAMVLGSLLGGGARSLAALMRNKPYRADDVFYIGLQGLHDFQEKFLEDAGVDFKVQTEAFVSEEELQAFIDRFDHILVHLDIDVLDPGLFHSTYFADNTLVGDGSGGGRMTMEELTVFLEYIFKHADVVGLTIAEYLPFAKDIHDQHRLQEMFANVSLLSE